MTDSITPTQNVHQVEVAIAGAGKVGRSIARELIGFGHNTTRHPDIGSA